MTGLDMETNHEQMAISLRNELHGKLKGVNSSEIRTRLIGVTFAAVTKFITCQRCEILRPAGTPQQALRVPLEISSQLSTFTPLIEDLA